MLEFAEVDFGKFIGRSRALCLDYGLKRTGVAISDLTWTIASPFKVLETKKIFSELAPIIEEYQIELIVVGAPIALNGGMEGAQHKLVNEFCAKLEQFLAGKNSIVMQYDERMSTAAANRFLTDDLSLKKKKNTIDKIAASIILQNVIDRAKYKYA